MTEPRPWRNQNWQDPHNGAPQQQPQHGQAPQYPSQQPSSSLAHTSDYWSHPAPAPHNKKPKGTGMKVTNIILLCVLALVTLGTLTVFAFSIGISVFLVCGALALIPLGICVATLMWIDRW
ncbi:MAG: hypothetical protein WBX27_14515, partial [Specibacter sp.]